MATRIPDARQLGVVAPSANRRIVQDQSGEILADGLQRVANSISEGKQRRDRFNYHRARSAFLQAEVQARAALENDPDYMTHGARYQEGASKALDRSLMMIKDPEDRALFEAEGKVDIERGRASVFGVAKEKEFERDRADIEVILQTNRDTALTEKDPAARAKLLESSRGVIAGAVEKGALKADQAEKAWMAYTQDYGRSSVAMLPPEERIKVLQNPKGTPAEFISPDDRVLMLRQAQDEDKETRVRAASQDHEDRIWAEGGGIGTMRAKARAIEDPHERDSTLQRIEARFADREADRERYDRDNRRAALDILEKTGDITKIPPDLWTRMAPEDRLQIKKSLDADRETDIAVWHQINQLAGKDPKAFMDFDLTKVAGSLSVADSKGFGARQEELRLDIRNGDPMRTNNQLVTEALRELQIKTTGKVSEEDAKRAADFSYAFERAVDEQFRATGRKPTVAEKREIKKQLMIEVVTERGFFRDTTKRLFEAETVLGVVVPDDERKEITDFLKRNGKEVTEAQIQLWYLRGQGIEAPP